MRPSCWTAVANRLDFNYMTLQNGTGLTSEEGRMNEPHAAEFASRTNAGRAEAGPSGPSGPSGTDGAPPQLVSQSLQMRPIQRSGRGIDLAAELLIRLFRHVETAVPLRLWNGSQLQAGRGPAEPRPAFALAFRNPRAVWSMVLERDPLYLAEAYFRGDIDIEGDFFAALALKDHLQSLRLSAAERLGALVTALRLRNLDEGGSDTGAPRLQKLTVRRHSKAENRDAIQFHYDVSNDFYALWLDQAMVYSCAYFEEPNFDLEHAQQAKLEHICRKLMLKPGERFLDVGCGWGALVMHAARHHGVQAHGITLSNRQLELARRRISEAGLEDRVTVELRDYRDLAGGESYDKIASIGMFEHVGLRNLPAYFSTIHRLLKPTGLFLNHGITHKAEGWTRNLSTEFINRYVFPDGELDTISNIQQVMERSEFEIADVEAWRPHYALTLRAWVARLESNHARALEYVNESTYRVWRLYMAACALEFGTGAIGVYQVLACKRGAGPAALPLTRRFMYPAAPQVPGR
jgi:cyclopropane-fatty-acyl-phospholipid synthase